MSHLTHGSYSCYIISIEYKCIIIITIRVLPFPLSYDKSSPAVTEYLSNNLFTNGILKIVNLYLFKV